ncbi:MAG: hypothetical protein GAK28_00722 [Luteibacter sp.]|uniref:hypothetical protein n=1 Tax=Luteibacter sp. TaxID=1886636 RepID=UPI001380CE57|nr:hypothetical protein [Luteibacter sp.]KAF1009089.1 MAG: hypothetical protein GAK28_00722 [Luteibacter sp.]
MEASIERQILVYLHRVGEAQSLAAIADGVGCSQAEATNVVRDLIRRRRAARHHVGPGELRYTLLDDVIPQACRVSRPAPRKRIVRASPKQDRILAVLGDRAMTVAMIVAASGDFTKDQVRNLLSCLQAAGRVTHGEGRAPYWQAVKVPTTVDDDELPPCVGEAMRDTTHAIYHAAAQAAHEDSHHA